MKIDYRYEILYELYCKSQRRKMHYDISRLVKSFIAEGKQPPCYFRRLIYDMEKSGEISLKNYEEFLFPKEGTPAGKFQLTARLEEKGLRQCLAEGKYYIGKWMEPRKRRGPFMNDYFWIVVILAAGVIAWAALPVLHS